jgi:hypothetical protein
MSLFSRPRVGRKRWILGSDVFAHRDPRTVLLDQLRDVIAAQLNGSPGNGPATETTEENAGSLYTANASCPVTASTWNWDAGATGHFDRR